MSLERGKLESALPVMGVMTMMIEMKAMAMIVADAACVLL